MYVNMNIDMYIYIYYKGDKNGDFTMGFHQEEILRFFFSEYHGDNGILLVIYKATKLLVYMILV